MAAILFKFLKEGYFTDGVTGDFILKGTLNIKTMRLGILLTAVVLNSCVMNTNVAVTKDSVVVQNNITISEKILKLLFWL